MRWPVRSRTDETSLAVERPQQVNEIAVPLPSVSLDDLMARLWIAPSTPEPALAMAPNQGESAHSTGGEARKRH